MKRVIGNLYTLKGGEAVERTNELKKILGLGSSSAGFVFSEPATTQIDITGSATTAIKTSTGTFVTGINLGGTLTTGMTIGACTTAVVLTGACTTGISITGASTTAAIDITAASGRALRIGTKGTTYANSTALTISSLGGVLDTDPAKNYMVGVFTKVSGNEDTGATDDLGSAWFRTRVDKGATTPAGYSLFGVKSQLRIYSGANSTIKNWAAAGLLGVLEVSGSTTTFSSGCVAAAVYANVALTTASVIASGAVVAGLVINNSSAAITNTGSAYYGLYIQDYVGGNVDFNSAIKIANSCATTGITIGTCTTGISIPGGVTIKPMTIGTKANTSGSGIILAGDTDDSGGVQIYADDGGVTTVGDVLSPLRCRYLVTVGQTSGKTQTGSFSQMRTLGTTSVPLVFNTGAVRAAYIFNQLGGTTLQVSAEAVGINQATNLAGNMIVGSGCSFSGVDINISGTGAITNNGTCAGLLIRSKETPVWTNGIQIADAGAVTGIKIGTCTTGISITGGATCIPLQTGTKANTSGSGVKLVGSGDNSGGVQLYFDDGGISVVGEVVTPIRTRMLVTVNQTSGTSVCGSFSQLVTLGTTGATKNLTTGALRASYIFNQIGALTMTSAAEVAGINQATTVAGNTTVDTTSTFTGIDINIRGAGTVTPAGNGVVSGLYIRSSETAQWTTGIKIKDAAAPTAIAIGTCTTALDITGSASVTNLFKFASVAGCILNVDVNPKDVPSTGGLGADACIRVDIGGADYFIPLFTTELS